MTITEQHDDWLLVQLEEAEVCPDLDWDELVKWKIPAELRQKGADEQQGYD